MRTVPYYLYCLACGETHEQALRSAAINGPIEGVTVGGIKWLGNTVASRVKAKLITKSVASTERSTLKPYLQLFTAKSSENIESLRLIPGTEGIVTGDNSTRLGKNMLDKMGVSSNLKWTGY